MNVDRIGRYEVLQVLGRGAMGVVYLVSDPVIDRRLAVKTLRVDLDDEHAEEFRERFTREARAAGRLTHNGIVTIHDVGEDPETGLVFIAMEYVKGHDLKQILASGHRFRPSEAARIAADVAQALDYAHSMGVIHRDIKPANVILTADGTAKIMDFGVARLESSNLTVEGQFIGTPNFMSPEQITGKAVDGRSDIFSLGVLLYNLLTGQRPFAGETMHEVTMKIVQQPCAIPSTVSPGLPAAFNPIVLKCMEKDPEKRFQSGGEVARVLAALARSAMQREPAGGPERTAVVSPDMETRVLHPTTEAEVEKTRTISPNTAAIRLPKIKKRAPDLKPLLERLPLPPLLLKEVHRRWSWPIIASWTVLWALIVTVLIFSRDPGPFPAPSDGAIRNLHVVASDFRRAGRLLEQDRLGEAERVCMGALAQVPSSPGGRRLMTEIRSRVETERTSEATTTRVDELVAEGRRRYRSGNYDAAAASFEDALDLNPESEMASSFLELTLERRNQEQAPQVERLNRQQPTPVPQRRRSTTVARKAEPTPGTARITLYFNSPISVGSIVVRRGDEIVADEAFNFTRRILGIKRKGTGQVKKVLVIPSGRHTLTVELTEEEAGSMGVQSFTEDFSNGSDWSLRIDLPKKATEARFYLVNTGR